MMRFKTESGDWYVGTKERWAEYQQAVGEGDWDKVLEMEEGLYKDFYYSP